MPVIILCGDSKYVKQFCDDYTDRCNDKKIVVHRAAFSEAISDVIEDDTSFFHIITRSYCKSERYISYCHAKRFKTGYIVVFLQGNGVDVDLEVPLESNRYDNPLITVQDYSKTCKNELFSNINGVLSDRKMKRSRSNEKIIAHEDYIKKIKNIINEVHSKYDLRNAFDICVETENRMMSIVGIRKIGIEGLSEYYESMLREALYERGMLNE